MRVMGVSGVTETKKKTFEPARDHFIKGCQAILAKFRNWFWKKSGANRKKTRLEPRRKTKKTLEVLRRRMKRMTMMVQTAT